MATTIPNEELAPQQIDAGAEAAAGVEDGANQGGGGVDHNAPYRLNLFQTLYEAQRGGGSGGARNHGSLSASHHHQFQQDDASYYAAYRKYCTSKISRISHRQSVRHVLVHSSKYHTTSSTTEAAAGGTSGPTKPSTASHGGSHKKKRNAFVSRDLSVVVHEDCLWHLVFQSERAWSNACEIQRSVAASNPAKGGSEGKKRQHAIRRLQKARQWSQQLLEMAEKHCDAVSVEECRSYAEYMAGNVYLEKKQYRSALKHYRLSRSILVQLASASSSQQGSNKDGPTDASEDDDLQALAQRDVWTTRSDSLLQPLIRFCEYESRGYNDDNDGDEDDVEENELSTPKASSSSSAATTKGEILLAFRGRTVALDSYQELAVLYLKLEQQLHGGGGGDAASATDAAADIGMDEDAFLGVSNDLDAAARLVQAELKRYDGLPDGPAVRAKRDDLLTIRQYVEYQKLSLWRKQQEKRLANAQQQGDDKDGGAATTTEADLLHVYDTLLQNAVKTADLQQQQSSGAGGANNDDDPLWLETQAHVLRFRAFRCYYLARFHEENPDYAEDNSGGNAHHDQGLSSTGMDRAEALFRQAGKLAARAIEEADACDGMEAQVASLQDLVVRIRAALCRIEALRWLEESGAHSVVSTSRPLWMRLNDWDAGDGNQIGGGRGRPDHPAVVWADNPPLPMAVPCKPSFFDVAWQHLPRDDSIADEIGSYIASHEPKRSFLDWVRGGWK